MLGDKIKNSELIQWHNAIEFFDYDLAIDWAIELMKNKIETENVLMLASFSKPVNSIDVKPYVSAVLKDLKLEEKYGKYSVIAESHYYLSEILEDKEIKSNLSKVYDLCNKEDHKFGLQTFYLIYHAWLELEESGYNNYYEGVTLDNIIDVLKEQALIWIDKYVHNKELKPINEGAITEIRNKENEELSNRESFWLKLKNVFLLKN